MELQSGSSEEVRNKENHLKEAHSVNRRNGANNLCSNARTPIFQCWSLQSHILRAEFRSPLNGEMAERRNMLELFALQVFDFKRIYFR
jgi:hypothetical protein